MDFPPLIGRYVIIRQLGQGGMGRVLLARDTVLERLVAVKVLRDDASIPKEQKDALVLRMRHEAKAAAKLSHPNMVTLHDMGEEPDIGLYLVFEYVEGRTLRSAIADGPIALVEAARIARQIGDALTHAHETGVIHRDVKPENVLLAKTGAKLADFGIARIPDSTLTGFGAVLGTPAYSAPESLALGEFTARSDQFSLAATLYEAVSGRRAFPGDDALTVAGRVATESPLALTGDADLAQLTRLETVLTRGMAKDPNRR
jgi:serine/threonine-protein kinase